MAVNGAVVADNLPQLLEASTKAQMPQLRSPAVPNFRYVPDNRYTDLYAATNEPEDVINPVALGFQSRGYVTLAAEPGTGAGFTLEVQDDVRGFTAEAHNTASSAPPAQQVGGTANDGIKVEVEFDGAAGTTSF
jgi:hypothetical protein